MRASNSSRVLAGPAPPESIPKSAHPGRGVRVRTSVSTASNPIVVTAGSRASRLRHSEASICHPFRVTLLGTTFPGVRGSASTLDLLEARTPGYLL